MATRIAVYGKIDFYEFDSNWDEYERLEHFFTANEISDKDKIKSILLPENVWTYS